MQKLLARLKEHISNETVSTLFKKIGTKITNEEKFNKVIREQVRKKVNKFGIFVIEYCDLEQWLIKTSIETEFNRKPKQKKC